MRWFLGENERFERDVHSSGLVRRMRKARASTSHPLLVGFRNFVNFPQSAVK